MVQHQEKQIRIEPPCDLGARLVERSGCTHNVVRLGNEEKPEPFAGQLMRVDEQDLDAAHETSPGATHGSLPSPADEAVFYSPFGEVLLRERVTRRCLWGSSSGYARFPSCRWRAWLLGAAPPAI